MLYLTIFLSVTVALLTAFRLSGHFRRPERQNLRRRLAEEFGAEEETEKSPLLFKNLSKLSELEAAEGANSQAKAGPPWSPLKSSKKRLEGLLHEGRVSLTVNRFVLLTIGLTLALGLACGWFGGWILGFVGAATGLFCPFLFILSRRRSRREKYVKQLAGAFELMARVLRSGQSVGQSLQAVAEAFDDPIAGEFASCQHQQNMGLRPEVAFQEMAQRSGILELRIFAMAMTIQRQCGGNLSEVLDRLSSLSKLRHRSRQQVRSLTAEGRMQAITLIALPFLTFAVMYYVNRQYASSLLEHSGLLATTAAMMVIGIVWIRRIVNIEA